MKLKNGQLKEQFVIKEIEIRLRPPKQDVDKLPVDERNKKMPLDDNVIKIIENEYATKYLESLNIEPTVQNIRQLLQMKPLSECQIISGGWSGGGMMAENIRVIPNKRRQMQGTKIPSLKDRKKNIQDRLLDSK